ncbi:DUF881 domain-containing protein [soil metagenome]
MRGWWQAVRVRRWSALVPVSAAAAGLLFAISAETASGTDLRAGRRIDLTTLIAAQEREVAAKDARLAQLQEQIEALRDRAGAGDTDVAAAQADVDALGSIVGMSPVAGPALTVSLDDAPTKSDGTLPEGASPNDVVVHQSDVQAVVNALWAGGAEAMTIMGERVIATSAVRCVGNTLLLHGRTYSPPFQIAAIGEPRSLEAALDAAPGVALFRQYVDFFGLGYEVEVAEELMMPGYAGPLGVTTATPVSE